MWRNDRHAATDDEAFAVIRDHPLVTIISGDPLIATHMPVLVERAGDGTCLVGHVPRADPVSHQLLEGARVLVVATGPAAYVSPAWYRTVGRLPTYDFVTVHVTGMAGPLSDETGAVSDDDMLRAHLADLIAHHEGRRCDGGRWQPGAEAVARIDTLLPYIAGFRIRIDEIQGKYKLGQQDSPGDVAGVIRALSASPDTADRSIAALMRQHSVE